MSGTLRQLDSSQAEHAGTSHPQIDKGSASRYGAQFSSGVSVQATLARGVRSFLRLPAVLVLLHLAAMISVLSQYYVPHRAHFSIQFREEEVSLAELQPQHHHDDSALLHTIREIKASEAAEPKFVGMAEEEIIARLDAALQSNDFVNPPEELGLRKADFCKLAAMKSNTRSTTANHTLFEEPRVRVDAPGIVLTTYFNSRVDPLRCYMHKGGHIGRDNMTYMALWYHSVARLGLPAVVFHESLSQAFVESLETDLVRFQRVQLSHTAWSLCDERWAVYLDWLESSGSRVQWVLQVDVSDTVLARNPFQLFQAQAGQYDLWVNVQKNTDWMQRNYLDCYGSPQPYLLGEQGLIYNAGVLGGSREAFADLAAGIVREFRGMYSQAGRAIWNCDMAALHYVLAAPGFMETHRIFNQKFPFCAGSVKCTKKGECGYYIYHK